MNNKEYKQESPEKNFINIPIIRKILVVLISVSICFILWFFDMAANAEESTTDSSKTGSSETGSCESESYANLVIFAYLSGDEEAADSTYFDSSDRVSRIIDIYEGNSDVSVKNYLSIISNGKLSVDNIFPQYDAEKNTITPMKLTVTKNSANYSDVDAEIVSGVISQIPTVSAETDYDNDGIIDNLTIILVGGDASGANGSIYPHMTEYAGSNTINGEYVRSYNILNTYRIMGPELENYKGGDEAGVICHEFLHSIGFTDLYKYDATDKSNPVYTWSIMGSNSRYLQYPLAYERMYFGKWLDLQTITESGTYTVDPQTSISGNPAYIIKSPLNTKEFFVVEFRKKTTGADKLEYKIGYPLNDYAGLIVYRVNTSVEGMNDKGTEDAFYVFRPQAGQIGYDSDYPSVSCINAALSAESGRTTVGSADMSATLADGALTFSDGTNSGIVISTSSSAKGDSMDVTITFPYLGDYIIWNDENYKDTAADSWETKSTASAVLDNYLYVASYNSGTGKIECRRKNDSWTSFGGTISAGSYISSLKMFSLNSKIYLSYNNGTNSYIYEITDTGSALKGTISGCYDSDPFVDTAENNAYFACINSDYTGIVIYKFTGSSPSIVASYSADCTFIGQPQFVTSGSGGFLTYRNAANNNEIVILSLSESSFTSISNTYTVNGSSYRIKGSAYNVLIVNGKLYLATVDTESSSSATGSSGSDSSAGGSVLSLYSYDAVNGWNLTATKSVDSVMEIPCYGVGRDIYFVIGCGTADNTYVTKYSASGNIFENIGEKIDIENEQASMAFTENKAYLTYIAGKMISVRSLEIETESGTGGTGSGDGSGTDGSDSEDTTETLESLIDIRGYSLTVFSSGKIGMNVRIAVPTGLTLSDYTVATKIAVTNTTDAAAASSSLETTSPLSTAAITKTENYTASDQKTREYALFDIQIPVDAKMQCDTITVSVNKDSSDIASGTASNIATVITTGEVSVKSYAMLLLGNSETYELEDSDIEVLHALLNYGSAAQKYFDYEKDSLANSELNAADQIIPAITEENKNQIIGSYASEGLLKYSEDSENNINYLGSSLILGSQVNVRHYFKVSVAADGATDGTADVAAASHTFYMFTENNVYKVLNLCNISGTDIYYIDMPAANISDYTSSQELLIADGNYTADELQAVSADYCINYSVFSYYAAAFDNKKITDSSTFNELLSALYDLNAAVTA